ncbi:MAG TPA: DJ-1/PfpI family protein [Bacteroidota bacterium]
MNFIVAIPIYNGVDLLDVAAPYEMFHWMGSLLKSTMQVEVYLAAEQQGTYLTRDGMQIAAQKVFSELEQVDLLWVPGGNPPDLKRMMNDAVYLNFLRSCKAEATYLASVCEGALLLAAAGLLDGFTATTHWAFIPCLKKYPNIKIADGYPRFFVNEYRDAYGTARYVITGGGISSGLDEALEIVKLIAGEMVAEKVQQTTQYYPVPPVESRIPGSTSCPLDGVS